MPEARDPKPRASVRRAGGQDAGHDAELARIDALIDRLVPALTAKLAGTHLGELEVREGEWRIRLRRPASSASWSGEGRRVGDRPERLERTERTERGARSQAAHDSHGHGRAGADSHRVATPGGSNGTGGPAFDGGAPGASHPPRPAHEDDSRRVATSPAVGVFRPGPRAAVGTRVREGDTLGNVDVLGVPEEIRSPADGMITELLVETGTAVEYGQELLVLTAAAPAEAGRS